MLTWFSCPMRCTRSSACWISPGTQVSSANRTVLAAVSVRPVPAALMLSTATRQLASSWKRLRMPSRSFGSVVPSIRM